MIRESERKGVMVIAFLLVGNCSGSVGCCGAYGSGRVGRDGGSDGNGDGRDVVKVRVGFE